MAPVIDIENLSGDDDVPDPQTMRGWIDQALAGRCRDDAEIAIRIVDDAEITALNRQYRHREYATNVLSFPAELPEELDLPLLGDIAICAQVVAREAAEQGKSRDAHWAHMLVHGTLHLLGYDHIDDGDAQHMESLETDLITRLGFPPPYDESPLQFEGEEQ